jgi:predicted phage baseplate assembly protein
VVTYDSGGGVAGNVAAGTITELRSGVAYFQSVTNPVAAAGGAEAESAARVAERGPQRIRHRDRAVTAEDFEWLAREASPAVHRARCRPLTGPDGFAQRGWVTLIVVSDGPERQPIPTVELQRQVRDHVAARVPAAVASRIRVSAPEYVRVTVVAEVVPLDPEQAAVVQARVRANLDAFLHPVTGGPDGLGWSFGEPVYLSQIAGVIEGGTDGVDYCVGLRLAVAGALHEEVVPVGENGLVSAGDHEITVSLGDR